MTTVDFATFCFQGDRHRLYVPGQLRKQVESNNYPFDNIIVVHQCCDIGDFSNCPFSIHNVDIYNEENLDRILADYLDLSKPQYQSDTDKHHSWRYHVVNHLVAAEYSKADYIVFADSDCWIVRQLEHDSWIKKAVDILKTYPKMFIVSPNDGEPERATLRMSQQMFIVNRQQFLDMDFNQPGYSGNPRDYDTMPEYHGMLEGRMHYHCQQAFRYRYVLGPEYRYFHHNRLTEDGLFDTDYEKLGWV